MVVDELYTSEEASGRVVVAEESRPHSTDALLPRPHTDLVKEVARYEYVLERVKGEEGCVLDVIVQDRCWFAEPEDKSI